MTTFTVLIRDTQAGPVLELAGDLDDATAPLALQAVKALTPRAGQQVVVDLTELRFCDSSGISTLIAAHNLAHAADAGIALAGVPRHLARALALVGLGGFFVTHPTVVQAQTAWADPRGE
ncbi:STAS domain-containing protein [Lentzea sp. NPDC102401]|uniref:STAS domain-containing protein n=1 Tax=Lentzea sp. NPDC102401 TaxID=3364128 RepID=UPI0037F47D95